MSRKPFEDYEKRLDAYSVIAEKYGYFENDLLYRRGEEEGSGWGEATDYSIIIGRGWVDHTLYGDGGNDYIDGGWGDDTLYGRDGNDALYGSHGDDTLYGGDGYDFLYGSHNDDTLYGEDGEDVLLGAWGDDYLYGGNGNDFLRAGHNDDHAWGGAGNDFIVGGQGNDYLNGGDGDDTIIAAGGFGGGVMYVTFLPKTNTIVIDQDTHQTNVAIGGAGNDLIVAYYGHNYLYGNEGNDEIYGSKWSDIIGGGDGNDEIYGGKGREDTLFGGAGDDSYFFSKNDGRDIITDTEGENNLFFGTDGRGNHLFGHVFAQLKLSEETFERDFYAVGGQDVMISKYSVYSRAVSYSESDFDFARDGDDLVISTNKGNEVVIQDYAETSFNIYYRDAGGNNQEMLVPEGLF